MPTITAEDRIGTLLEGKYRLDRVLGEGGMGVVFAGEHIRLKRPIAVKFLHSHVAQNADARHRFVREAESAAMLKHPNVVDVMDVGETPDGSAYMVLEYLRGDALADYLHKETRISESKLAEYMIPVLHAVGFAHTNGIVHRDLKPDNIFLSHGPNGIVIPKVLDFGIAKVLDAAGPTATQTGSVMGTPLYMSPEQAHGLKTLGPPADVWSLGVILYECIAGRLPWEFPPQPTLPAILITIATRAPAPIATVDAGITPELATIIDRCLAHDPAQRYANANEVAGAIETIRAKLRATVSAAHASGSTALGIGHVDVGGLDTHHAAPAAATFEPVAPARASNRPAPGPSTGEIVKKVGLPTQSPNAQIRSMTSALWALAAIAAIALVGGAIAIFSHRDPVPTTAAMPPSAPVVPAPPPVAPPPPPAPAAAVVTPPPSPAEPASASDTTSARRPRVGTTDTPMREPVAVADPPPVMVERPTTGTSSMRRCANGVCSDLGGL